MVFVVSLEDAVTKLHLLDVQALFLRQAAPLYQKKEDHWLHFSSSTVKILSIAWVQAMGTWETDSDFKIKSPYSAAHPGFQRATASLNVFLIRGERETNLFTQ